MFNPDDTISQEGILHYLPHDLHNKKPIGSETGIAGDLGEGPVNAEQATELIVPDVEFIVSPQDIVVPADMNLTPENYWSLSVESGISDAFIRESGAFSATEETVAMLTKPPYNFGKNQVAPGTVFPLHTVLAKIGGYSLRRNDPIGNRKYENPFGQRASLYMLPSQRWALDDPNETLYLTEGIKKVLSAASVGMICIGLGGVWNWRGSNEFGGKKTLADWHEVALNGRTVDIVFDNDVMVNPKVRTALDELTGVLRTRGARVRWTTLPEEF